MEDSNAKSKLRDIFPDINEDAINLAVSTTTNLNEAIDYLISNNTSMDEGTLCRLVSTQFT